MRVPTALLAASAWGLVLIGPTSAADPAPKPAGDSCAALSKVQPAIDNLRDNANAYLANQAPAAATEQKAPPVAPTSASPAPTTAASPAAAKLQNIVDSLRRISGELKSAAPAVADSPLRNSADKLAGTVDDAADSVSQIASSQANSLNPLKLGSLGVNITGAVVVYQANYTRVCGQSPAGQQAPTTTAPAPAKPSATTPATPQQTPAQTPKRTS
ncbi:MAG: hypothetical protein ACRC20_00650 [Segniliparus sp.]